MEPFLIFTTITKLMKMNLNGSNDTELKQVKTVEQNNTFYTILYKLESSSCRNCVGSLKTPAKYIGYSRKCIKAECASEGTKGLNVSTKTKSTHKYKMYLSKSTLIHTAIKCTLSIKNKSTHYELKSTCEYRIE